MGRKKLRAVLVVAGLSLVALAVSADALGLGGGYVFGWEQKLGVAVGVTIAWFSGLRLLGWYPRRVPAYGDAGRECVTSTAASA